jgi:hypothetical protein
VVAPIAPTRFGHARHCIRRFDRITGNFWGFFFQFLRCTFQLYPWFDPNHVAYWYAARVQQRWGNLNVCKQFMIAHFSAANSCNS